MRSTFFSWPITMSLWRLPTHFSPRSLPLHQTCGHSPSPLGIPVARCRERSPSERDFSSIEEVIQAVAETDPNAREVASRTLQGFQPYLIVNRVSGKSRVNVLHLKKLLQEYVGGDLTTLGEIPDDPAVTRAVRSFLPVVECEPTAPAALALSQAADALLAAMARQQFLYRALPAPEQVAQMPIPS